MTHYPRPAIAKRIIEDTAAEHGLTVNSMLSGRYRHLVRARWDAMSRLRDRGYSGPHIAFLLGLKDHTTVHYGLRRHSGGEPRLKARA